MGEVLANSHNASGLSPRQASGMAWDARKVPTCHLKKGAPLSCILGVVLGEALTHSSNVN